MNPINVIICITLIYLLIMGIACYLVERRNKIETKKNKLAYKQMLMNIFEEGFQASKYVPATANPYKEQEKSKEWLKGWISWQQNKESEGIIEI